MGKTMNFSYDKTGDILYITIGKAQEALSVEVDDDVFVRVTPKAKTVVGLMILNFQKRLSPLDNLSLPIKGSFNLPAQYLSSR